MRRKRDMVRVLERKWFAAIFARERDRVVHVRGGKMAIWKQIIKIYKGFKLPENIEGNNHFFDQMIGLLATEGFPSLHSLQ